MLTRVLIIVLLLGGTAIARDFGQWDRSSEMSQWYQTLMQPDNPAVSCCGEADAYWCDDIGSEVREDQDGQKRAHNFCRITDDRPDEPRRRPHREIGTKFEIPDHKMKYDQGNPTGHGIIFLSTGDFVYCYVSPGGV